MTNERSPRTARNWGPVAATYSFTGAIFVALLGGLLTVSTWILGAQMHPWIRDLGTVLMVLTIPLLIFCGCCLDWADRQPAKPEPQESERERGSMATSSVIGAALFLCIVLIGPMALQAQQSAFNVPTTDVIDKGKVYFELDISPKPNDT